MPKQTRTRTQRVITKGSDFFPEGETSKFFTRELAFARDDAMTVHEESMH